MNGLFLDSPGGVNPNDPGGPDRMMKTNEATWYLGAVLIGGFGVLKFSDGKKGVGGALVALGLAVAGYNAMNHMFDNWDH